MSMVVQKVYRLHGPKGRRYLFIPLPGGRRVRVERWEPLNGGLKSSIIYSADKARWLWGSLIEKNGYIW